MSATDLTCIHKVLSLNHGSHYMILSEI